MNGVLQWTPMYGHTSVDRSAKIYRYQFCAHTRCSLENLPGVINDMAKWGEGAKWLRAISTWWWFIKYIDNGRPTYLLTYIYIYIWVCLFSTDTQVDSLKWNGV